VCANRCDRVSGYWRDCRVPILSHIHNNNRADVADSGYFGITVLRFRCPWNHHCVATAIIEFAFGPQAAAIVAA